MENKEVFHKLYVQHHEYFKKTREIQWKINFGLWTFLAIGIQLKSKLHIEQNWIGMTVLGAMLLAYAAFVIMTQNSLQYDKIEFTKYKNALLDGTGEAQIESNENSKYWIGGQIVMTLSLLALFWIAKTNPKINEENKIIKVEAKIENVAPKEVPKRE